MTKRVSKSRRAFTKSMLALPAAASRSAVRSRPTATAGQKCCATRSAWPRQDSIRRRSATSTQAASSRNIFDAPLAYDFIARPAKVVPNTAEAMPEISADFTDVHRSHSARHLLSGSPGVQGQEARTGRAGLRVLDQALLQPEVQESKRLLCWKTPKLLGLSEIRAAALKGAKFDYDREVEGVRALDRYTLRIKLGEPGPRFHHYLADSSFLGAVAREVDEMYDDKEMMANPVGTGPYRLVDWRRSSRIVLEKNPGYREDYLSTSKPTDEYGAAKRPRE